MPTEPLPDQAQPSSPAKKSILKKALSALMQVILLAVVIIAVDAWMTRNSAHGTPPPLEGKTISGEYFSIDGLKGEVGIIHFWGTWCPVCNLEQGTMNALNKDFHMMTIALQSGSDAEISQYLRDKGVSYPVLNDDRGVISSIYGVTAVPVTFVLDRHGEIRYVTRGYSSELGLRFRLWLASL